MVDQSALVKARLWIHKKSNYIVNRPTAKQLYISARSLSEEYNQTGRTSDLEKALQAAKEAYNLLPEDHPIMAQLATCFWDRFRITGHEDDFNESKRIFNLILSQNPDRGPELDALLKLSLLHACAYVHNTKCTNFEESIRLARRAVERSQIYLIKPLYSFSERHPYQHLSFKFLAYSYHFRFKDQKNLDDLKKAIQATRQAIKLDQENDRSLRRGLKDYLYEYYTHTGERSSLEEVISLDRQALDSAPTDSLECIFLHFALAHHLWDWCNKLPAMQDFSEATKLYSKAAQMVGTRLQPIAKEDSKQASILIDLGKDFFEWYRRTGEVKHLAKATRLVRQAVEVTPLDHCERVDRLLIYGMYLVKWTDEIGTEAELKDGIEMVRTIEYLAPDDYLNERRPICILISILRILYRDRLVSEYLQQGIRLSRRAIDGISNDGHHLAGVMFNLVIFLSYRYAETRALADQKEALKLAQRAVDMTPLDHPRRVERLTLLAIQFQHMGLREDKEANMNRAADLSKLAMDIGIRRNPREIRNIIYHARFLRASPPEPGRKYLDEIIDSLRSALALAEGVEEQDDCLSELSSSIFDLYNITGDVKDADEAIRLQRDLLNRQPINSRARKNSMYTLSKYLEKREIDLGHGDNFEEATQLLVQYNPIGEANKLTIGNTGPCRNLISLHLRRKEWEPAFELSNYLINRLPTLTLRYLEPSDKQWVLSLLVGLASDASTSALQLQKDPVVTLGLLERARGMLASSMEEMRRTDFLELQGSSPEQMGKLINLRRQLDMLSNFEIVPSAVSGFPLSQRDVSVQQTPFDERYNVGREIDRTLEEVGRLPEFKAFFSPPTEQELRDAAAHGPIVVIAMNYSDSGCDAIIIEPNKIHRIVLPNLKWETIAQKIDEGHLGRPSVLAWLWDTAMGPILDALGYTQPVVGDDTWPHVWWIPTGELAMFPLHAAGRHTQEPHNTVLSRVVSSYSNSVRAIIQGRRRRVNSDESPKALLVAMETTPYQSRLPYATEEIKVLKPLCNSINHTISEPARNKKAVLRDLQHCNIFHFAGHGCTVRGDPGNSYLCLEEGPQNPIRVNDLLNLNLFARPPFLAYLSACGTGQVGSTRMVDESVHLISACQLSGFLHVIGTLWEVNDKTCVDVAEIVYKGIRDGGMSNKSVAQGLHNALLLLRDQWVTEIENLRANRSCMKALRRAQIAHNAGLKDDEGQDGRDMLPVSDGDDEDCISPPSWVPYVHFGI